MEMSLNEIPLYLIEPENDEFIGIVYRFRNLENGNKIYYNPKNTSLVGRVLSTEDLCRYTPNALIEEGKVGYFNNANLKGWTPQENKGLAVFCGNPNIATQMVEELCGKFVPYDILCAGFPIIQFMTFDLPNLSRD